MSRASEIEERALEYQKNFSYENFRVIRKELFAHLRDPSLTIRTDGVTFNTACISKLEGVVYIKILLDDKAKQLAIKQCDPDEKNALRWCVQKEDGSRKSRKMKGDDFAGIVSTTVGGIPKIVKNQINGYTCEPGNVSEFATKIIEILQDKSKCQNYGNMSLKIIKESYSLEAHIKKIESIYNSLIS